MAKRFVRLDLSDTARDFFPIAVEPGVAMLDDSNAHNRILFRWLGGIAAEPVWEGDSVSFFVQDDRGGRLEEAVCQPVIAADLTGVLKEDFALLRERIEEAQPETATERALHKCVQRWFKELLEDPDRTDHDCYFFRYRDASGCWRLVWCWGFQRRDREPAPAVICTDPECSLLFVRRPNQSHRCPSCEAALPPRSKRKSHKCGLAAALLLLILAAGFGWWWTHHPRLSVEPENVSIIEGEIADLKIDATDGNEPVTVKSNDPSVVEVVGTSGLVGRGAGSTQVEVAQGDQKVAVGVTVEKGEILSIALASDKLVVPVDDTIEPRVTADVQTKAGRRRAKIAADRLTCEKQPSPQFARLDAETMRLTGVSPTQPQAPQTLVLRLGEHQASASVEVVVPPLRLTLEPAGPIDLPVGQMRSLRAIAEYKSGRKAKIPSHLVQWQAESPGKSTGSKKSAAGLELRDNKVAALKSDARPLSVYAVYYGNESNRVIFKLAEAEPVTLRLKSGQEEHHPGDTGEVRLTGETPHGEVELVPDLASFRSSEDKILAINAESGAYRAITPGAATITGDHAAAKTPATLKLTVLGVLPEGPQGGRPKSVKILSRQGQSVQLPVGAEFDDFRVEAEYPDGSTLTVTQEATLTTPEPPQNSPVAASNGRLVGVRPGRTSVNAKFDGVAAEQPLAVEVTAKPDIDEIRLAPTAATVPRGETISMSAVGYKNDKSVGDITGWGNLSWQSDNAEIARVDGPRVTGLRPGKGSVTARLGSVVSRPASVKVVDAAVERLVVKPESIRLRVGESVRIGADLSVMRGEADVGGRAEVTPELEEIVRYVPETRSLVGVSPGKSSVAVTVGSDLVDLPVEVLPPLSSQQVAGGKVLVEPVAANLAPGQSLLLRVFLVTPDGERIDRTASAVLRSSNLSKVKTAGDQVWAIAPGEAEIVATLPDVERPGIASITVNNAEIITLLAESRQLDMSVGEKARLQIFGVTADGTRVLFPQSDLKLAVGGDDPKTVHLDKCGNVRAVKPGRATITVRWRDKLNVEVPVRVTENAFTDLRLEPALAVIRRGQLVVYRVTVLQGKRCRVLGPKDGVQLSLSPQKADEVVQLISPMTVRGNNLGRTFVIAEVAGQKVQATLDVVDRNVAGRKIVKGKVVKKPSRIYIYDPGSDRGYYRGGAGGKAIVGGAGKTRRGAIGQRHVRGGVGIPPAAASVGLRFIPDKVQMSRNSPPVGNVRVVEVLADGHNGRDVTANPNLKFRQAGVAVRINKTSEGVLFSPKKEGLSRVTAQLGSLTTGCPLLIVVGDVAGDYAWLVVSPEPLTIWSGETAAFDSVRIYPGLGHLPFTINYRLTSLSGQTIVESVREKELRGLTPGTTHVIVTAVDPLNRYNKLSTMTMIRVVASDRLSIEPSRIHLEVGQLTPRMVATVRGSDGLARQVDKATLESLDPNVLAPDKQVSGRFVAKTFGATQIRASYRGKEAVATVNVSGKRFVRVTTKLNAGNQNFDVGVKVLAAKSEGLLEYRIYVAGQPAAKRWTPAETAGKFLQVELRSPRMAYGPHGTPYQLILEARSRRGGSIQRYPLTFQLESTLKRLE